MHGICKLCECESELESSHFIPKFVIRWIKKTSITGYLRDKNNIGKRAQDLAKEFWLCRKCEELFSKWESEYASKIFLPYLDDGKSTAKYGHWMSKFCASLSWRTLTYIRSKNIKKDKSQEYYDTLDKAEQHLANYLLGKVDNLDQYEQHVFPLDKIASTTQSGLPTNINRYLLRSVAMDIIGNSSDLFIYTKLPSFIILGAIYAKDLKKMRASRIAQKSGNISPREYRWPDGFINYIVGKSQEIAAIHDQIPTKQLEKIEQFIRNNPEKAANSKLFEAFLHDYELFGDNVFR